MTTAAPLMAKSHPPAMSQAVKWWHLINQMEQFSAATGLGLASVWGLVHRGEYEKSRARFEEVVATVTTDRSGP